MKLNCIIDTCSCLCLSNAEFRQNSLLHYLNIKAHLNYSNEVHIELRDHDSKGLPSFIHDNRRRITPQKFSISEYERRMLGRTLSPRSQNDKGEVDNFLISVDQLHQLDKNSIIFITDDKKALRGILYDWVDVFPAIKFWTSYEVVLFLYAEDLIPSKEIALDMIREVISLTAPKPSERSEKTTAELISTAKNYSKRIEKINSLLK